MGYLGRHDDDAHQEQGDPGTLDDAKLRSLEVLGPRRLYYNWERAHWSVEALDFTQDHRDWAALSEERRRLLVKSVAPFFVGENRVANTFGPILMSATDEHELAFLSTQQVDEARHAYFFDRWWSEVFVLEDDAERTALVRAEEHCNVAFTELFDRRLKDAVERLRRNPSDVEAKIEAVTIYHLIIEGTLAVTAMHFVLDYFQRERILPGVTQGLYNTKGDEHRHIAFGTWFLREKCREADKYGFLVQTTLMELLPVAAGIMVEGGRGRCDGLDPNEYLDYPSTLLNHYAMTALSRRLKVIGGATQEVQQFAASTARRAAQALEAELSAPPPRALESTLGG